MRYLRFISGPRMGTRVTVRLPDNEAGGEGVRSAAGKPKQGGAGQTVILGRERTAGCPIDDLNISRRHAELFLREGRTVLRDLKSTNGTFVNGELVTEKVLVNGDQISVGDTVMIFEESGSRRRTTGLSSRIRRPGTQAVTFEDRAEEGATSHIRLDPQASGYFNPAAIRTRPEAAERLAKLYKFISEVAPVVSPDRLAEEVLDRAFEAIAADRGFIMVLDEAGDLQPVHMRVRDPARRADTIKLSRRMTQRVLESGQSILSSDTLHDRRFKDSISFSVHRVNSFVCAPLKHRDKMIGLLYVDTVGLTKPLTEDDLELVTAMARLAGTQFANARYYADVVDSAEYTQSILRCLSSGLVVTDLDLKIRQVNEAARELLWHGEQDLVGRSFKAFKTLEPLWRIMHETVRSGIPSERQEVVVEVAGEQLPVAGSTTLLRDHENRPCGVVANFRSMKVINKLTKQLRMAQHLAALGEMAAGIAHEIRNPLNSIRGFAQLMGEMLPEADAWAEPEKLKSSRTYIGIIVEEVDRMNRLVQDLLDFSRQRELAMTEIDVVEVVEGTLRDFAPEFDEAAVEVVRNMPEGPVRVLANAAKLKQVLLNVIRNAVQAMTLTTPAPDLPAGTEQGARRLEVSVSTRPAETPPPGGKALVSPARGGRPDDAADGEGGPVEIAVKDSGSGMDKETKARLFEPFFTTRDKGTGLGLAICRKIVEQHGGTIEVDSRLGAGTTMRILLPRG